MGQQDLERLTALERVAAINTVVAQNGRVTEGVNEIVDEVADRFIDLADIVVSNGKKIVSTAVVVGSLATMQAAPAFASGTERRPKASTATPAPRATHPTIIERVEDDTTVQTVSHVSVPHPSSPSPKATNIKLMIKHGYTVSGVANVLSKVKGETFKLADKEVRAQNQGLAPHKYNLLVPGNDLNLTITPDELLKLEDGMPAEIVQETQSHTVPVIPHSLYTRNKRVTATTKPRVTVTASPSPVTFPKSVPTTIPKQAKAVTPAQSVVTAAKPAPVATPNPVRPAVTEHVAATPPKPAAVEVKPAQLIPPPSNNNLDAIKPIRGFRPDTIRRLVVDLETIGGFAPRGAATMTANILTESSGNPNAVGDKTSNDGHGTAEGLFQLRDKRKLGLPRGSIEGQIQFEIAWDIPTHGGAKVLADFRNPYTPQGILNKDIFDIEHYGAAGSRFVDAGELETMLASPISQTPQTVSVAKPTPQAASIAPRSVAAVAPTLQKPEIITPVTPTNDVVNYSQYDPRWARNRFGTSTIAASGCGPTTVAEIVATMVDRSVTPATVAAWGNTHGGFVAFKGSSWGGMLINGPAHWNLHVQQLPSIAAAPAVIRAGGEIIIVGTGRKPFTPAGHILALVGLDAKGNFKEANPDSPVKNPGDPQTPLTQYQIAHAGLSAVFAVTR